MAGEIMADRSIEVQLRAIDAITPVLESINTQLKDVAVASKKSMSDLGSATKSASNVVEQATSSTSHFGDMISGAMSKGQTAVSGLMSKVQGMVVGIAAATAASAGLMKIYVDTSKVSVLGKALTEQAELNHRWRTTGIEMRRFIDGYSKNAFTTIGQITATTDAVFNMGEAIGLTSKKAYATSDAMAKMTSVRSIELGGISGDEFAKMILKPRALEGAVEDQFRSATLIAKKEMPGYEAMIKTALGRATIVRYEGSKLTADMMPAWTKVSNAIERIGTSIGKIVGGPLSAFLTTVADIADSIAADKFASLTVVFGILAGIALAIVSVIGAVPAIIAAVGVGILYIEKRTKIFNSLWAGIKANAAGLYTILSKAFKGEILLSLFGKKGNAIEYVLETIKTILGKISGFFGWLIDGIKAIPDKLAKAMDVLMDPIRAALGLKTSAQVKKEGEDTGWLVHPETGAMFPKGLKEDESMYVPLPENSLANKQRQGGATFADAAALKDLAKIRAARKTPYTPDSAIGKMSAMQVNTIPGIWTAPEDRASQNTKMPETSIFKEDTVLGSVSSGLKDAGNWLTSVSNKYLGTNLASHASGTPFVPEDMVSLIHKGEKIIPASQNRAGAASNGNTSVTFNMTVGSISDNIDLARVKRDIESIIDKKFNAIRRGY
jgi:hypothetical protein